MSKLIKIFFSFIFLGVNVIIVWANVTPTSPLITTPSSSMSNIEASIPAWTFWMWEKSVINTTVNEVSNTTTTSESTTTTSWKSENSSDSTYSWPCNYTDWVWLSSFLNWCKPKTLVGSTWEQMTIEWWFRNIINEWIVNISLVLWVLAVWSLVYAAMLMQFSWWEDELIKKSKNIIKWTIIGFILLISASGIVYVVVNVMFWLWE